MFCVVDIETTGVDPAEDAIIEIGCCHVVDGRRGAIFGELVRPRVPIKPDASAIHHIIDEDVATAGEADEIIPAMLRLDDSPVYVAHNAAFERSFLEPFLPDNAPWLCTFKAAKHVWENAPAYSNQTLRYWLGLPVDRRIADVAHRAGPDAYVTAYLLCELLKHATIEQMLEWTNQPAPIPTCPLKKHKGKAWIDVPTDYLEWMLEPKDEPMDADLLWHAQQEVDRRTLFIIDQTARLKEMKRNDYLETSLRKIAECESVAKLTNWWKTASKTHFPKHGIEKGDDFYNKIVAACQTRKQTIMHEIASDPLVKAVLDRWPGAEIVAMRASQQEETVSDVS